ncbi:unnamed protein product [Mycena citricolor]|uniref:Uncharacterized protein n=1 Tax=Mycena citricolor TaxID=2018698 RepID=A0AAD2I0H1_9AGAR|nr:unnamed protein product [Mycena citricolor]
MTVQMFGQALPDQVDNIASLLDAHLHLLTEVREVYKDRAALEREYATKLQALSKRASEKRAKSLPAFVVGDEPTRSFDPTVLDRNTLNAAFNELISSMNNSAQDHVNLADALTTQVVDVLKNVERAKEELKKREMAFFQKLVNERDRSFNERLKASKAKGNAYREACKVCNLKKHLKYDDECSEVESVRQKQVRASDDRHAERAARQAEQQRVDMLNSKNVYIISTRVANAVKAKFYDEDLPALEDQFQILQGRLVRRFAEILSHSQALEIAHLDTLKGRLAGVEVAIEAIDPAQDQNLFIEYNIRSFTPPVDWKFEPCVTHYDTEEMSIEPAPKVFLQNKLSRCRSKLKELAPVIDGKRMPFAVPRSYLEANHQLTSYATSERILKTEAEVISAVIGDDEGDQQPHSFKSSSFSIPTQCAYCKSSIWGLSKQGKTCKACGISVHSKCELKVPANCKHATGSVMRSTSRVSPAPPTPSAFVQSVAEETYEETYQTARVLFDFTPTSEFELHVSEGASVQVLEPDTDGSGWVKVSDGQSAGLVPASYISYEDATSSAEGSGKYVRGVYPYSANGPDELSVAEGELIELTEGPSGGQHYGDGWWEGKSESTLTEPRAYFLATTSKWHKKLGSLLL